MSENVDNPSAKPTLQFRSSPLSRFADERVDIAWRFAQKAHQGQTRKVSGMPFFVHPVGVAENLAAANCPVALVIAALLHDAVEDAGASLSDIQKLFGKRVAHLVAGVTCPRQLNETWRDHRHRALSALDSASDECLLLKCADALDNLRSIRLDLASQGECVWHRLRPKMEFAWYYRSRARILGSRLTDACGQILAEDFAAELLAVFGRSTTLPFARNRTPT